MELNLDLAKIAIKFEEFQMFMQKEIKITDDELKELIRCGVCWNNFDWLDRTISKINIRLEILRAEGKLETPKIKAFHQIFDKEEKEEALKYISESDADTFQIILRKQS